MSKAHGSVSSWVPILAGACGLLWAHETARAADTRAASSLEEVIVTATRRPEPLREVPQSVSVLTGDELALRGARNFRDYANSVAGVSFSDVGFAGPKVTIRGVSTDVYSEVRPLTATYLDEIPVTHPGAHVIVQSDGDPELVDIERVEVLRGPQGTLYGASSLGGALRIVTRKPDPAQAAGYSQAMLSTTAHGGFNYGIDGVFNQPLGQDAALRLAGYYRFMDGYIDNIGTGKDDVNSIETTGGRIAYGKDFGDRVQLLATLFSQSVRTEGFGQENIALPRYTQRTLIDENYDDDWILPSLVLTVDLGWGELLSSTAWQDREWRQVSDISGFAASFDSDAVITGDNWQDLGEFIQELRLSSKEGDGFDWLVGLFFNDRDHTWRQTFPAPGFDADTDGLAASSGAADNLGIGHVQFDHQHVAVFGEIEWPFAPRWQVSAGARWYRFEETSAVDSVGFLYGGTVEEVRKSDDSGVVPKLTLSWRPDDASLLYATTTKGFRPSGPNYQPISAEVCAADLAAIGLTEAPASYKSDKLWNYEIGGRTTRLDGRLEVSGAVYYIDWTDVQILAFLLCGTGFTANAGEARSQGAEIELTVRPADGIELAFGGAYIDAELTEDAPTLNAPSGSQLPGVPRFSGYGSLTKHFRAGANLAGYGRVAFRYVDKTYGTFVPAGTPRLVASSYSTVDLVFGLEVRRWSASIFAENLFDEHGVVNAVDDFGLHPGGDYQNLVRPRTVGLNLRLKFD